jgi:hypothetical protein
MNYPRIACRDRIKLGKATGGSLVFVSIAGAATPWATVAIGGLTLLVGGLTFP